MAQEQRIVFVYSDSNGDKDALVLTLSGEGSGNPRDIAADAIRRYEGAEDNGGYCREDFIIDDLRVAGYKVVPWNNYQTIEL